MRTRGIVNLKRWFSYGLGFLMLVSLFLPGFAMAGDRLASLEMRILGRNFMGEPMDTRVKRLEEATHTMPLPDSSLVYRLEQLYRLQDLSLSAKAAQSAVAAYNHGIDHANQGRYEEAIEAYRKAIELNPAMVFAYNNLGTLLEHVHRYPEALQVYQKALAQKASDPLLHRNIGVVYEKLGNVQMALDHYRIYVRTDKNPDPAMVALVKSFDSQRERTQDQLDYVAVAQEGSEGAKLLWPESMNPIPVYIHLDPDQTAFLPAVWEGFRMWEEASQTRLQFREVGNPSEAKIHLTLREGPLSHPEMEVGRAAFDVEEDSQRRVQDFRVTIFVNTGERNAPIPLKDRLPQVRRLALHEIGHAIGIWGHSPNPDDVMYSHPIATSLSPRDIRTVQRLYELIAGPFPRIIGKS